MAIIKSIAHHEKLKIDNIYENALIFMTLKVMHQVNASLDVIFELYRNLYLVLLLQVIELSLVWLDTETVVYIFFMIAIQISIDLNTQIDF